MTTTHALRHFYKKSRTWQKQNYGNSGLWIDGIDQRQFTGGGAAYGCHALAAYNSAKGQIHFREVHNIR